MAIVLVLTSARTASSQDLPLNLEQGHKVVVTLPNGDVLHGAVRSDDGVTLVLQHDLLGLLELPRASLTITQEADQPLPAQEEPTVWSGRISGTVNGATGNTVESAIRGRLNIVRNAQRKRDTFTVNYARDKEANDQGKRKTSKDQVAASWQHEIIDKGSPWLPVLIVRNERDRFKNYNNRGSALAGLGYGLIDTETQRLIPRFGAGVSRKFGSDDEDDYLIEAFAGAEYSIDMTSRTHFSIHSYLIPAVNEQDRFRSLSHAELRFELDDASRWYLNVAVDHEYDNSVDEGDDEHDLDWWVGLGLRF